MKERDIDDRAGAALAGGARRADPARRSRRHQQHGGEGRVREDVRLGRSADEIVAAEGLAQIGDADALGRHRPRGDRRQPRCRGAGPQGPQQRLRLPRRPRDEGVKGKANPKVVNELLKQELGELLSRRRRLVRGGALIVLVYAAAAVVVTWPLAAHLDDDARRACRARRSVSQSLDSRLGAARLDRPIPRASSTAACSTRTSFIPPKARWPIPTTSCCRRWRWRRSTPGTSDAVLCYNLLLLASIALSGLAMHALVRAVTGSHAGAFLAGLAWACWPYRTAHLLHIQLQALYFMPLALLCLHRVVAPAVARRAAARRVRRRCRRSRACTTA